MVPIPTFLVDHVLLGKGRRDAVDRMAQDAGIVVDVWLRYAQAPDAPLRLLLTPQDDLAPIGLGGQLHRGLQAWRKRRGYLGDRVPAWVMPAEGFIAATLYLDELVQFVLPMTPWYESTQSLWLAMLSLNLPDLESQIERTLRDFLGDQPPADVKRLTRGLPSNPALHKAILDATPVACVVGLFDLARRKPALLDPVRDLVQGARKTEARLQAWLGENAGEIAKAAIQQLSDLVQSPTAESGPADKRKVARLRSPKAGPMPSPKAFSVHRVFLNRDATLAVADGVRTVKADASQRVFDLSCRQLTWAVVDAGIDGSHPAFLDHSGPLAGASRVRQSYDFTRIEIIRSFDLTLGDEGSDVRNNRLRAVADQIASAPGRQATQEFIALALNNLAEIARQLDQDLVPDWELIEPLVRLGVSEGAGLLSDHGTHVAGILAADWRTGAGEDTRQMVGMCPDLSLIDLRVLHETELKASEAAVIAALEFLRHLNERQARRRGAVQGVNISLSIPHDVRNYACGATPICRAVDRLSDSGVVVVAAAGNRGWNEQDMGFGNHVFCSVTDPGNARKVITVGATHRAEPHTYGVSFFSSRGPTGDGRAKPDLLAPGEKILGPLPGGTEGRKSGTSMAAPFVSGAAALLMARYPELIGDSERIKILLCDSATDLGRERYFQGHGLVNTLRALQSI